METLHTIYNLMPLEAWLLVLGGPAASLIVAKFKKWLQLQSEKVVVTLLFATSGLESIATYIIQGYNQNPGKLAPYSALITTGALAFYHMLYKPTTLLIRDAKAQRAELTAPTAPAVESAPFEPPVTDTTVADSPFSA